jgi:ribosomal protein S18 acetylase RimI-like enzyme
MKSAIVVRRMAAADLPGVMDIAESLKEAPHWPRSAYLSAIGQESAPRRIALVAEEFETGRIAGFAIAILLGPEAELETIAVPLEWQRRGIGGRLVAALLHELKVELKSGGACLVLLEVRESNQKALAFYRSRGWRETGRRPRYYADPEEDAVLMTLDLD